MLVLTSAIFSTCLGEVVGVGVDSDIVAVEALVVDFIFNKQLFETFRLYQRSGIGTSLVPERTPLYTRSMWS